MRGCAEEGIVKGELELANRLMERKVVLERNYEKVKTCLDFEVCTVWGGSHLGLKIKIGTVESCFFEANGRSADEVHWERSASV